MWHEMSGLIFSENTLKLLGCTGLFDWPQKKQQTIWLAQKMQQTIWLAQKMQQTIWLAQKMQQTIWLAQKMQQTIWLAQKMQQSWSTALPRHQKKERWRTNNDKTNATYETIETQTQKQLQQSSCFWTVSRKIKLLWGHICFGFCF